MGLIQKLKSALGLDGAQSPEPGTATPGDVDVTVEREPSSESEDAVKGTETAGSKSGESAESDSVEPGPDESSPEEAAIEEAEPDVGDSAAAESSEADSTGAEATEEPAAESGEEPTDESGEPVTDINGIGPAYGQRLSDAGVESVADLAAADAEELEAATDISANRIQGWVDAAAEH